jgi:hypothetical protein
MGHLSTAWAAVVISGVTVVANIFGVMWAGHTQRRLAHQERIGDRRIETYVELLKWLDAAEDNVQHAGGQFEAFLRLRLPDDLRLRIFAFASDRIVSLTREFQSAWLKVNSAIERNDDERIRERVRATFAEFQEGQATSAESLRAIGQIVKELVPEYDRASETTFRLRDAVRSELTGERRAWPKSVWARRATQHHEPV